MISSSSSSRGTKIIHGTKTDRPSEDVTSAPEVGYVTTRSFEFPLAQIRLQQSFTVVVANAVVDGGVTLGETTWTVDPSTFR